MSELKKFRKKLPGFGRGVGEAEIMCDGRDLFVLLDGVKIAKRGEPGSALAAQWISIEPGYRVLDGADGSEIVIQHHGVALH
jgi:hypothetical protein